MFVVLAGAELTLGTGVTTAPAPTVPSDDLFLSPAFVHKLVAELLADTVLTYDAGRCRGAGQAGGQTL